MAMQTTGSNVWRADDGHQHDAADRRHAGPPHHVHHYHPAAPAVKLDLPQDQSNQPPPPIDPVKNKVVVTAAGAVLWNGAPVNLTQLRQYLDVTQQMDPIPELHLQPEPDARYVLVDEVLAVTKQAKVSKMGFVGNEAYMTVF